MFGDFIFKFNAPFIAACKEQGWEFYDGKPTPCGKGFYEAHPSGGYCPTPTWVPTHVIKVVQGCPAYHGTIAISPV